MKTHIAFATAASALVMASQAMAADLPGEAAPAAVDYVKVCDAFGAGFFYIPGGDTCLKISGRVRSAIKFDTQKGAVDTLSWNADARVGFDARTATDIGTLRSFFQIKSDDAADVVVDNAFIQLGYVTIGYAGGFYGDGYIAYADNGFSLGRDITRVRAEVLVDDIGGGFYAGAGIYSATDADLKADNLLGDSKIGLEGTFGVADASWGKAGVAAYWEDDATTYGVKASATIKASDVLSFGLNAGYVVGSGDKSVRVGAAASYAVTPSLVAWLGAGYSINDVAADELAVRVGADYTITKGLDFVGEVGYNETNSEVYTLGKLIRVW